MKLVSNGETEPRSVDIDVHSSSRCSLLVTFGRYWKRLIVLCLILIASPGGVRPTPSSEVYLNVSVRSGL